MRSDIEVSLKRYRYCSKERDEESGLYYYGLRYYAHWLGRWLGPDKFFPENPLQEKGQSMSNLYCYAASNPISYKDRRGAQAEYFRPEYIRPQMRFGEESREFERAMARERNSDIRIAERFGERNQNYEPVGGEAY